MPYIGKRTYQYGINSVIKLPTTFTSLDLQGFNIEQGQQHASINREMVNIACAVLQKNRVGIVTRSVQAALKHIYGIGGSADTICLFLKEWRAENLALHSCGMLTANS